MDALLSPLQEARTSYELKYPKQVADIRSLSVTLREKSTSVADDNDLKKIFPKTYGQEFVEFSKKENSLKETAAKKVGVVLSGGQAPGGHNVIAGLYDALIALHPESQLYGFIGGPGGIVSNEFKEITSEYLRLYRNQGGFDIIGSGRTKIETQEQFAAALETAKDLNLDGLVIIGGDDSNTNAAMLAEYFLANACKTKVVGVPKTIDGDLKNEHVEASFGFDTACKVYAELIGNLLRDCLSSKKYYHFIKLMGRSASHITLECALQTHPNVALIGEEVAAQKKTLAEITKKLADVVCIRAREGKNYGVVLVPEGLVEFIPEIKTLISELNDLLSSEKNINQLLKSMKTVSEKAILICGNLTPESAACFNSFPSSIQEQLLVDRDPHGNVQVSRIETERLLIETVSRELRRRKEIGEFEGEFSTQHHFLGYEGRSAMPSNFDCLYCNALGFAAALALEEGLTGYMAVVRDLMKAVDEWTIAAVPLTSMMHLERRQGKDKPVIQKALVDLEGKPFRMFTSQRQKWSIEDRYRYPGPIQYFGDSKVTDGVNFTLEYESM